jgi:hypothetical protein
MLKKIKIPGFQYHRERIGKLRMKVMKQVFQVNMRSEPLVPKWNKNNYKEQELYILGQGLSYPSNKYINFKYHDNFDSITYLRYIEQMCNHLLEQENVSWPWSNDVKIKFSFNTPPNIKQIIRMNFDNFMGKYMNQEIVPDFSKIPIIDPKEIIRKIPVKDEGKKRKISSKYLLELIKQ